MTVSRPGGLRVGVELRLGGRVHTVVALSGAAAGLADATGHVVEVALPRLLADPSLELVAGTPAPLPASGALEMLPAQVLERARWWERHIVEVLTGRPPEPVPGQAGRAAYDPAVASLRQRELAKVAELEGSGHRIPLSTLQRMRLGYERDGLWGLVDGRALRRGSATGRVDARVVAAARQAITGETGRSTGTVARLERRTRQILAAEYGDQAPPMPAQRTFYRLVRRLAAGRHTFGSARTRRSLAQPPEGPFGTVAALRPGEWVQIDSTPLDVRVVLDDGLVDRVELTWMIDMATRTIPAAVLRPTTKAVDAAVLLARALTPEAMRPGWPDALAMSRSVLPHRRLTAVDQRLAHAAARPVIVPETVVCDHGSVYMSQAFRNACRAMGVNLQPTHERSPWEKGGVETSFSSLGTLFAQYVAGYVGNCVERRGEDGGDGAVWSMVELQDLLDEWLVACWQHRRHDGLRHPLMPATALTPNEMYAALVESAGYVPVPLGADDYVELLPLTWRAVNSYGIKIKHRRYDCAALNPYRRQHSGVTAKRGLWEVHHDPYDVTRIWVRNHHDGGWIQATWTHLASAPAPFGEQAWDHARRVLARRGHDGASEAEIADAVGALLDRAEAGPDRPKPSVRDRRVAGRNRSMAQAASPRSNPTEPTEDEPTGQARDTGETGDGEPDASPAAPVVPLGIYDPFAEARRRW